MDDCIFKNSYLNTKKYEIENFNLDIFFEKLTSSALNFSQKNKDIEEKSIDNIKQNTIPLPYSLLKLYKYLLNSSINYIFYGRRVSDILADVRSEHIYTKVIAGQKLVQVKLIYIDFLTKTLTFKYPISEKRKAGKKHLHFKIKIDTPMDFSSFKLQENYILGASFKNFEATVFNKKQIKKLSE